MTTPSSATQDPELSAALGWPGGISNPVLDRKVLLQKVAALMQDKLWEDHRVRHLWDHTLAQQAEPVQDRHRACPTHCCPVHGCKYGHDDCPVAVGAVQPVYPRNNGCESCADDAPPQQAEPVEPVAQFNLNTMPGQADAHLRALLRYTENFYATAIEHGMRAGPTANAIAHVERAGKALHQIVHAQAKMLEPARPVEPVEPGAWVASKDGRVIYDDASTDDGLLRVSGDFENDEQRVRYAQRIVDKLNAAPPQRKPLTSDKDRPDQGATYVEGYGYVDTRAVRAVEKASWEKNHG